MAYRIVTMGERVVGSYAVCGARDSMATAGDRVRLSGLLVPRSFGAGRCLPSQRLLVHAWEPLPP